MAISADSTGECPFASDRHDSKSAAIAAARMRIEAGAERVSTFKEGRDVLLSKELLQGGAGAATIGGAPEDLPVFYLDGAPHREKRASIANLFTPKAITSRYHAIIERETERLLAQLKRDGHVRLDVISFELTVAVAANIVGLTESDIPRMARRLATMLSAAWYHDLGLFARVSVGVRKSLAMLSFYRHDIRPALRARRRAPREDLLSQLLERGASRKTILIECMTYAAAGMVTTREFIVMCAWHLLDRPELRREFIEADEARQFDILLEILRLEPIAAVLYRRGDPKRSGGDAAMYALDTRAIHSDEEAVGPCPHALDPGRAQRMKSNGAYLSFGAGAHHCPGKQVALHETRMFLDTLLKLPGVRLERAPDIGWTDLLMSYELRNAVVACDRA